MKRLLKITVLLTVMLGTGRLLLAFVNPAAVASVRTPVSTETPNPMPDPAPAPQPVAEAKVEVPVQSDVSMLDERRQFALGMIETGNNDREIGGAGEISRYQIMPAIWHQFTSSRSYRNPVVSQSVAQQLWTSLYYQFKQSAHREPTDFDMYVLWNTRYGYYASRGFNPRRLGPTVRDRAQRFVNLVERGEL